ncbi:hypothetical protein Tco_0462219 [Tanacetum coccineum]
MSTLQGPVVCPSVCGKKVGVHAVNDPLMKAKLQRSGIWGFKRINSRRVQVRNKPGSKIVTWSFSSSSNGNGNMAESFNEHDSVSFKLADLYLTEKEPHQLHLDEEALRETLEEKAMDEKAREEKIRQKQADDDEFFMEFGVVKYDSEYESD